MLLGILQIVLAAVAVDFLLFVVAVKGGNCGCWVELLLRLLIAIFLWGGGEGGGGAETVCLVVSGDANVLAAVVSALVILGVRRLLS